MAVTLLVITVVLEIVAIVLSWGLEPHYDTVLYAVYAVTLAGAGAAIVARYPRHSIGWLFLAGAVGNALFADAAQGYGLAAAQHGWVGGSVGEWLSQVSWLPSGLGWILTFLLFPSGVFGGRTRRRVALLAVIGTAVALPGWGLSPDLGSEFVARRNPVAVDAIPTGLVFAVGMVMFLAAFVAAVGLLVARFVRARGNERQQLKWFVAAACFAGVVLPASALLWSTVPAVRPLAALALTALPLAACVAILRYRLYGIDIVLNRTLVYSTLTAILAGVYAASAVVTGIVIGERSAWATAVATLVVAVAFAPLRRRVQDQVNRRFDRARYDAVQRVAGFVEDVRAGRAAPEEIEGTLRAALGVEHLELRFLLRDARGPVDVRGHAVADHEPAGTVRWPITQAGSSVGMVTLDGRDEAVALLPALLDVGALAIEITRLRIELRRQLEEVEASRARIAAAADEERRRVELDLHDGAQQRLVSIGLALRHAQHALESEAPHEAIRTLDGAVAEVAVAIDELRELARGIRPAHLDAGLGPALRELARRAPVPVKVAVADERFPGDIETAAYFTASEAVTNAVKHAQANTITVRAEQIDGKLVVSVADDGIGGAQPARSSGLTGLSDRVTAHGGTLTLISPPGRGTTLTAEFPCVS
jgi:signal transduction histidine kinase